MKKELTRHFVKKTIIKVIVFAFVMFLLSALSQSMAPVVSNEMALTQMQNSNEMFILMETYNKIRPIFNVAYAGITILFVYTVGRDTYKFVKNMKNTINEKEN